MDNAICRSMMSFLDQSHSTYHTTAAITRLLVESGFTSLDEGEEWKITRDGSYYIVRGESSVIAFKTPRKAPRGFTMAAVHSDSPTFRLRQNVLSSSSGGVMRLSMERYGSAIMRSWLDRPLSVAGRIFYGDNGIIRSRLVDVDRDLVIIPSVAPHLCKEVNTSQELKANVDMLPLFSQSDDKEQFDTMLAKAACVPVDSIIFTDLYLYVRANSTLLGANDEFVASPRLDDLACVWCCLNGFLRAQIGDAVQMLCVFDNEEVGSGTFQGAGSTFLDDTLTRLCAALGLDNREKIQLLANSIMVSADNAHAVHPAHPELYDANEQPRLNGGVVIKFNAAQKYTSDGFSAAVFSTVCKHADAPVQYYSNRADLPGGTTLGHVSLSHVSVPSIDIGLAQLAMHSSYEVAGSADPAYLRAAMQEYYSRTLRRSPDGAFAFE